MPESAALGRLRQENCHEFEFCTRYRMKHHLKNKHQPINNNKHLLNLRGKSYKSYVYSSETCHMYMCSCGYQADWEKASVSYIPHSSLCPRLSTSLPQRTITLTQSQINFSIVKLVQTAYRSWFLSCFFHLLVTCYLFFGTWFDIVSYYYSMWTCHSLFTHSPIIAIQVVYSVKPHVLWITYLRTFSRPWGGHGHIYLLLPNKLPPEYPIVTIYWQWIISYRYFSCRAQGWSMYLVRSWVRKNINELQGYWASQSWKDKDHSIPLTWGI